MRILILWLLLITLAACAAPAAPAPTPTPPAVTATVAPTSAPTIAPTPAPAGPTARRYALGRADVTVNVGDGAVEPLELRGTVAVPNGPGPHPVVLVLHGSHAVCPPDPRSPEEPEICPQATQFRNDPGLGYVLEALAARGRLALAPDLNTAFRAEFGGLEQEAERVQFVAERHLAALADGAAAFGLDAGVTIDPTRLDVIGHSRGGTWAFTLASTWTEDEPAPGGWRPARSMLLIAPLTSAGVDFDPPPDVPLAVVLPECDGDASFLEGQHYVEAARFDPDRRSPAVAYFLPGGNHNFFNTAVTADDSLLPFSRCLAEAPRLPAAAQQRFLAGLAPALLDAWEAGDPQAIPGFDPAEPVPSALYDAPVLLVPVRPAEQRRPILAGRAAGELTTSPLGGAVQVEGAELDFCPYGMAGNGSPCRTGVENPGLPAQLHLAWTAPGATVQVALPPAFADASAATALQLRLAADPLDPRSVAGAAQRIRVVLRDNAGNEAAQTIAVAVPPGVVLNERWFGHVFLGAYRLPLGSFAGIDPTQLAAVELQPENASGALFLADLELVSSGAAIAGPPQPAPYRSLSGSVAVPELDAAPPGSSLVVRLIFAADDATEPRFVTIQPQPVEGAPPFAFTLRYLQPAIDERRDFVLGADLLLTDGRAFNLPTPALAISAGQPQANITLTLAPVIITEPTPIPTDAAFQLVLRAPAEQSLPPGALVSITLSQIDASGMGVATLAVTNVTVGAAPADSVPVELPYPSSAVVPGASYGVSVDVFAADGMTRLAGTDGNVPVDLTAGAAEVQLTPAAQ